MDFGGAENRETGEYVPSSSSSAFPFCSAGLLRNVCMIATYSKLNLGIHTQIYMVYETLHVRKSACGANLEPRIASFQVN